MLKLKPYEQTKGYSSCGPVSLKIVLEFFGIKKTEKELIELTDCRLDIGTSGKNLLSAAKKLGLKGFIKDKATFKDLKYYVNKKKIPVIIDWFSATENSIAGHYSVIASIKNNKIIIADPEFGKIRSLDINIFKMLWFDFPGEFIRSRKDLILRRIIVLHK